MSEKKQNIDRIYTSIGRFAVEFEQICHTMQTGVRGILELEGLKSERIQEIMLSGLTAEPLSAIFRSLCSEYLKPNTTEDKIIKQVFTTFQDLIKKRNDLIHSAWFLSLREENDDYKLTAFGIKLHKKWKGADTKRFEYNQEDFQGLLEKAKSSLWNVAKLANCILGGYPLEQNFEINDQGEYEAIKGLCERH